MRKFSVLSMIIILAMILGACTPAAPTTVVEPTQPAKAEPTKAPAVTEPTKAPEAAAPTEVQPTAEPASAFAESPMLAEMVKAGTIPPVEERLPENPLVVDTQEIGQYGDTLRVGFTGDNPGWGGLLYLTAWENLVSWKDDYSGVAPNVAERWEVSDDVREYIFYLRKGIKWSDGQLFTADDLVFYVNDVVYNTDIFPAGPDADWLPKDQMEGLKAEKIDDFTFKITFPNPYGTFLYVLPTYSGRHFTIMPSHYCKAFHKDYNDKAEEQAKADGYESWVPWFNDKCGGPDNIVNYIYGSVGRPYIYPWVVTKPMGSGTQVVMERNPFYWKVDSKGNQLPYMDEVVGNMFQDSEAREFSFLNGDLDWGAGGSERAVYFDAKDSGKPIAISFSSGDSGNTNSIHFNRTIADPVKAEIFGDKNFRIGMSYAIDRPEIIEIVHNGMGKPAQLAPLEGSPLYNEQLSTQYTEFDLDKANEYLDKVLPNKDAEGFRLDKNGKRFTVTFTVANDLPYGGNYIAIAELLIQQWAKAGVDVKLNAVPEVTFTLAKKQNEIEATMHAGDGGAGITAMLDPRLYVPMDYWSLYSNGWFGWYRGGADEHKIVEPPQWVKDFRAEYEKVKAMPSEQAQLEQMGKVLQMAADEFWAIGISTPPEGITVYNSRVHNIPEKFVSSWLTGGVKIIHPERWFIAK